MPMLVERAHQAESRTEEERAEQYPNFLFKCVFWGRGKSKMNKFCLNGHDLMWPGRIDNNIRAFPALGEVLGFFMLCQSRGRRTWEEVRFLGHVTSLFFYSQENLFI